MALVASRRPAPSALVLVVVLIAVLAITVETTVINVALPTLNTELGASTTELQWIVDAYNLAFAALVLAGGGLGDRYGRRGILVLGLLLFAATNIWAALSTDAATLIASRVAMGGASALVYPTTLAIITATFRDRRARAAAIGAWGAVGGSGSPSGRCSAATSSSTSPGAASSGLSSPLRSWRPPWPGSSSRTRARRTARRWTCPDSPYPC